MTVHQAIGLVVKNKDIATIELSYPHVDYHTKDDLKKLRQRVHNLRVSAGNLEDVSAHPLSVIARADWSNAWQHNIIALANTLGLSAERLLQATSAISSQFHFDEDSPNLAQVQALAALAKALIDSYGLKPSFALAANGREVIADAYEASALLAKYARIREDLSVEYKSLPWQRISVEELSADWCKANNAWWPKSFFGRSRVRNILVEKAGAKGKPTPEKDLKVLSELHQCGAQIEKLGTGLATIPDWHGFDTDTECLNQVLAVAKRLRSGIFSITEDMDRLLSLKGQIRKLVDEGNELLGEEGAVGRALQNAVECQKNYENNLAAFCEQAGQTVEAIVSPQTDGLIEVKTFCNNIVENKNRLNEWCAWRHIRNQAFSSGLKPLVDALESRSLPIARLEDAFNASYCRLWVAGKMDAEDVLREFNSSLHQDTINQFKALDEQLRSLTSRYVRARICSQIPKKDGVKRSSEYGTLRRILEQKRPRKSLRNLITAMPNALTQLTPCVLMSPLSISQYLPVNQKVFDVVIFDEASQITVWDAIGSIARAKQTIVAGDPKQLPPTSFFGRTDDGLDDDGLDNDVDEGDLESILDEMLGAGVPRRHLAWHYRSENESLITFSNHKYYGGELITFPSPTSADKAVRLVRVNGVYQKGGGRTNRQEADAVVAEVVRRLNDNTSNEEQRTIGVVTFNAEQQRLIENLLDEERRRHPAIERHFKEELIEPVFVKNLESVQGDERDIILFSTTYGPDLSGRISMNFGPLNRAGGERRLNVAITRARSEMLVFSSLGADDIDLARTAAIGVRDLKHFLDFADRGVQALGEVVSGSAGNFESPFESAVACGLEERGWTVHPQIGVSAFRVDIGIVHPDFSGRYLVGVECDGATYHRSATARDRDKVREEILSRLGWKLLRLWSTDFWVNSAGELDRLHEEIQCLLEKDRAEQAA